MDIDLRSLRAFVEIAHDLSFSRAAERMSLTQPQLSMRIRAMEGRLGFRLFDRSSRKVLLSPQGAALLDDATAILENVDTWGARADALRLDLGSTLRIGAISYGRPIRRRLLARYRELYPDVTVEVDALRWGPEALAGFGQRRWAAAIMLRMDGQSIGSLDSVTLGRMPVGLLSAVGAPPGNRDIALFRRDISPELYDAIIERLGLEAKRIVHLPEASEEGVADYARESGAAVLCARWWDAQEDAPPGLVHTPLPGAPLELSCILVRSRQPASAIGERLWRLASHAAAARQRGATIRRR